MEDIITKTARSLIRCGAASAIAICGLAFSAGAIAGNHGNSTNADTDTYYEMVPHNVLPESIQYHPITRTSAAMDPLHYGAESFASCSPYAAAYTAYPSYTVPYPTEFRQIDQSVYPVMVDPMAANYGYQTQQPMLQQPFQAAPAYYYMQPVMQYPQQYANPYGLQGAYEPQFENNYPIRQVQYQAPMGGMPGMSSPAAAPMPMQYAVQPYQPQYQCLFQKLCAQQQQQQMLKQQQMRPVQPPTQYQFQPMVMQPQMMQPGMQMPQMQQAQPQTAVVMSPEMYRQFMQFYSQQQAQQKPAGTKEGGVAGQKDGEPEGLENGESEQEQPSPLINVTILPEPGGMPMSQMTVPNPPTAGQPGQPGMAGQPGPMMMQQMPMFGGGQSQPGQFQPGMPMPGLGAMPGTAGQPGMMPNSFMSMNPQMQQMPGFGQGGFGQQGQMMVLMTPYGPMPAMPMSGGYGGGMGGLGFNQQPQPQIILLNLPDTGRANRSRPRGMLARSAQVKNELRQNWLAPVSMEQQQQLCDNWGQPSNQQSTIMRMPSKNAYPYGYFGAQVGPQTTENFGGYYNMYRGNTTLPGN